MLPPPPPLRRDATFFLIMCPQPTVCGDLLLPLPLPLSPWPWAPPPRHGPATPCQNPNVVLPSSPIPASPEPLRF
jgi:hypothetical protein